MIRAMVAFDSGDVWWVAVSAFVAGMAGALALAVRAGSRKMAGKVRAGFLEAFGEAIDRHVAPKFDELRQEIHHTAETTQANSRAEAAAINEKAVAAALAVHEELIETAAEVKEQIRLHTEEEMPLVRRVVQEEIAPLQKTLDDRTPMFEHLESTMTDTQAVLREHMDADDRLRAEDGARLVAGQADLKRVLTENHAEAMGKHAELDAKVEDLGVTVDDHIEADIVNFAQGEQRDQEMAEAVHRIEQRLDTDRPDQPTTTPTAEE